MAVLEGHESYLAWVKAWMEGEAEPPPIARLVGFAITAAEPGHVEVTFEAKTDHANPMGTLHGGVLCDITDAAMGSAYATTLAGDETFTTLDHSIRFLRPFWTGRLIADATVLKAGRTIGVTEATVRDAEGRLVARASSTCMTLRGDGAAGR